MIQQGDVLVKKVQTIPTEAKKVNPSKRGYVLAEGESTGHAHVIDQVDNAELFQCNEQTYLNVLKEIQVNHEEHKTITIDPGFYEISIVREYDHFKEEAKKVVD